MKKTLTIPGRLQLSLALQNARFGLEPEHLFGLAARKNPQRAFLFVSRVLGKHLDVTPQKVLAAAKLLALAEEGQEEGGRYARIVKGEECPAFSDLCAQIAESRYNIPQEERTLFVGFAETATGLAHAVAQCYQGEVCYASTTRMELEGTSPLEFLEEHSHAREHRLHLESAEQLMQGCTRVALIDDELTTGNTALNIIRCIYNRYGVRRYLVYTLLDWRDDAPRLRLQEELGITIRVVSLLRGTLGECSCSAPAEHARWSDYTKRAGRSYELISLEDAALPTGRLPLNGEELAEIPQRCQALIHRLPKLGEHTLFLGTGELIYCPLLLTGFLGGKHFRSTTQSPIFPAEGSEILRGARFDPLDCYSPASYLYNISPGEYQNGVIFVERTAMQEQGLRQLTEYLYDSACEHVLVVTL